MRGMSNGGNHKKLANHLGKKEEWVKRDIPFKGHLGLRKSNEVKRIGGKGNTVTLSIDSQGLLGHWLKKGRRDAKSPSMLGLRTDGEATKL